MKRNYKMMVAALNSNGEPDLYFCIVHCDDEAVNNGEHYDLAKEKAELNGYEPVLAYDEEDRGGRAMLGLFSWETASVFTLKGQPRMIK